MSAVPSRAQRDDPVYRSPLLRKFDSDGRITIEMLRAEVPVYQAGQQAMTRLRTPPLPVGQERDALLEAQRRGEFSKDRLLAAGIPLIKSLALKEFRRRQAWQSQVLFDDLFQDAVLGYLRGLMSYDPSGNYRAPTNYIGQWIITEMRRSAEPLDNDFEISHEATERFRRIRALRSRLASELGRQPTDHEVVAASHEAVPSGGPRMGRVARGGQPKPLTLEQVAEETTFRSRVGFTNRIVPAQDGENEEHGTVLADYAEPILGASPLPAETSFSDEETSALLAKFFALAMGDIGMGEIQQQIVMRRYGLAPFVREEDAREISRALKVSQPTVQDVLDAFQAEMASPGGAFHKVCSVATERDVQDAGLGWVLTTLGSYSDATARRRFRKPDKILTGSLRRRGVPAGTDLPAGQILTPGVYARFICPFHGRAFILRYKAEDDVPQSRACGTCGRDSALDDIVVQA